MQSPPLIRAIAKDSVLSKTKLIAEPWDIGGYQVGSFPNWDVWAEWNGIFRDTFRRFFRGDPGLKKDLATRLSGSADLYHKNNRCAIVSLSLPIACGALFAPIGTTAVDPCGKAQCMLRAWGNSEISLKVAA